MSPAKFAKSAALAGLLILAGCPATEVVVRVESDLRTPEEIDEVQFEVGQPSGATAITSSAPLVGDRALTFPLTLGVESDSDIAGPLILTARARLNGNTVVSRRVRTSFVRGESLFLNLRLVRACTGDPCGSDAERSCSESGCVSVDVPAASLPRWRSQCVGQTEVCDGIDQDCDGVADNGFDLTSDPLNCGSCGHACVTGGSCRESRCDEDQIAEISVGTAHACARRRSGAVLCWGSNIAGQIGDGNTNVDQPAPRPVTLADGTPLVDATHVATGNAHSCALRTNGTIVCWGDNHNGQLGDGSTAMVLLQPRAVPVAMISDATAVVAGGDTTCAVRASPSPGGSVVCWGQNSNGRLGIDSLTPVRTRAPAAAVMTLIAPLSISAGPVHTCAVIPGGAVTCWGRNDYGQCGNGQVVASSTGQLVPAPVSRLASARIVGAGASHACALSAPGGVDCWGHGPHGELGNHTNGDQLAPVAVTGLTDATDLAVGQYHNCARRAGATLVCWGKNDQGQLGDGTMANHNTPMAVSNLTDVVTASAGLNFTCALRLSGAVVCWGLNDHGQLGSDPMTLAMSAVPVAVGGVP